MTDTNPHTRARRSAGRRLAAPAAAAILALLALGFLAAGGAALWANGQKDDEGFFATGADRFSTSTYALSTDELEVDADDVPQRLVENDAFGKIRVRVTPRNDKPVFVGIAPTADVEAYLRSTAHSTVSDVDYSPFHVDYRDHRGGRPSSAPSAQRFWTASAQGSDTQTVRWDVESGSWSVVVMNADGSAGVDAGISAGAKVPFLVPIGWGSLGIGVVLLASAGGVLLAGARPPRRRSDPTQPVLATA
jgi:hypothetical protein